jgi:hypothetical protein
LQQRFFDQHKTAATGRVFCLARCDSAKSTYAFRRRSMKARNLTLQPAAIAPAKRWAFAASEEAVEHPDGAWVRYRDFNSLRVAHARVTDKLRQVSELYQEALARREQQEQLLLRLEQTHKVQPDARAELAALRKLARTVARRAGNNPEIQQALRACFSAGLAGE